MPCPANLCNIFHISSRMTAPLPLADGSADAYLALLGRRVRQIRARRGMSRRILAAASGVSERYLAQLEAGKANPTVMVLGAVANAMHVALDDLVDPHEAPSPDYLLLRERLRGADAASLGAMRDALGRAEPAREARLRIALVGLRGAGKSTLGQALARQLGVPFVELGQEIEREAGMAIGEIFSLGGQTTYRRLEREALTSSLRRFERAVIAVGGSLVSEPETYDLLLASCFTVWLQAAPHEHMARVVAQGDHRPMADHRHAMADLKRILDERAALYARADASLDTADHTPEQSLSALLALDAVRALAPA
jgi:XRE family aerobic/anaerobic benzoate catabolism transcriptional regulator